MDGLRTALARAARSGDADAAAKLKTAQERLTGIVRDPVTDGMILSIVRDELGVRLLEHVILEEVHEPGKRARLRLAGIGLDMEVSLPGDFPQEPVVRWRVTRVGVRRLCRGFMTALLAGTNWQRTRRKS